MLLQKWLRKGIAAASAGALLLSGAALLPAGAASVPDFSSLGAVGCLTEAQTKSAAERIYAAVSSHAATAELSTGSGLLVSAGTEEMDSLMQVFATVVGGFEEGILTNKNSISLQMANSSRKGNYIKSIVIYYLVDDASYSKAYSKAVGQLDAISEQVNPAWSDVEKALFLHEYIAVHYDYDRYYASYTTESESYLCHTAYGMLERGKAVCEAYAWLYNLLLRREDIESWIVSSDSMGHAWNLVHLEDGWAHVDITWDDCYQGHCGTVKHTSFLKSSSAMTESSHSGDDWKLSTGVSVASLPVTDRYDEGFWTNTEAAVRYYGNRWLAIEQDAVSSTVGWFRQYEYDPETVTARSSDLLSLSLYWTVPGSTNHYVGTYITTDVAGDVLYYSTPESIMAYYDGEVCWQLDLTKEQLESYRIYGMYIDGDTLYYVLAASPTGDAVKCSVKLSDLPGITEPVTEAPTEPVTEAPTEPATEAPTEPVTEAPTEPVTEAPTEPVTEAPAEPATEAPTEPVTEAPTEPVTEAPTEPATEALQQGDLDGDGIVTVTDVIFLQRYLLCGMPLTQAEADCADVYEDGEVDVFDLAILKRMLLSE
ncbi:MAG: hypothetical protein IKN55_10705 [Oscillospiraceae bacterium]|nr:hypothetical protein [Oscillospiraceae bacterium]